MGVVFRKVPQRLAQGTLPEDPVDEVDDGGCRTPGSVEAGGVGPQPVFHPGGGGVEQIGIGPAEAVDGLLHVAYEEDAARALRLAGGQFFEQGQEQAPLGGVGVLEFVHQQVVDTPVQLVLHPEGMVAVVQELVGVPFQIGEIQQAAFGLEALVMLQQGVARPIPGAVQFQGVPAPLEVQGFPDGFAQQALQFQQAFHTGRAQRAGQGLTGLDAGAPLIGEKDFCQLIQRRVRPGLRSR